MCWNAKNILKLKKKKKKNPKSQKLQKLKESFEFQLSGGPGTHYVWKNSIN